MAQAWTPQPFAISVPEPELEDLRRRLQMTRLPDEVPDSAWGLGTNLSYIQELVAYWADEFDWRAQERRLNAFAQYRIQRDDLTLHYLHVPGVGPQPMPLLLIHGWPGSIVEFHKIIGPLTNPAAHGGDPQDAFTVVAPSLPGYGFSHAQGQRRYRIEEIAEIFVKLMTEVLGYPKFAVQGGDWGSFVAGRLGQAHTDQIIGVHLNMIPVAPHPSDRANLSEAETAYLKQAEAFFAEESGYQVIQGTKPQTLAYGLTDSPVGLAAWITEKFYSWSDCRGDIEAAVSRDDLLTNIMVYWVTRTINSSFWLYHQLRHKPWRLGRGEKIAAPTAVAAFPGEIFRPPREWAARVCNLQQWTAMPSGGHFAALEAPDALVGDVRKFFRTLR
ncbi:MAG: epoxide hydrolase [Proteobacteria bacterium]|nr:epoxide hydrolase [Pseudomonadota bacterium]